MLNKFKQNWFWLVIILILGFLFFKASPLRPKDSLITSSEKSSIVSLCQTVNELPTPKSGDRYKVWLFGDTHYGLLKETNGNFLKIFAKPELRHYLPDNIINVGDITQDAKDVEFLAYLSDVKDSGLSPEIFHPLAGNHDGSCAEDTCYDLYKKYINEKLNYTFDYGNIHFIFVTADSRFIPNQISLETFYWLEDEVKNNQDKIIVVVTHHPPLFYQTNAYPRFVSLVTSFKIDLWLFGHTHCALTIDNYCAHGSGISPTYPFTCYHRYGTTFIDTGTILNNESRYLVFTQDSDILQIGTLDHNKGLKDFVKAVQLSKKFKFSDDGVK